MKQIWLFSQISSRGKEGIVQWEEETCRCKLLSQRIIAPQSKETRRLKTTILKQDRLVLYHLISTSNNSSSPCTKEGSRTRSKQMTWWRDSSFTSVAAVTPLLHTNNSNWASPHMICLKSWAAQTPSKFVGGRWSSLSSIIEASFQRDIPCQ